ncbi:MAG TPA: hypothetical protein VJU14_07365 [Solirubrobacterales bacterium]|nr:hypothetical protein [Solirubrobacterales bacterium]
MVLVLLNAALNDGADTPSSGRLGLNPVAAAAERVEKFPGGRASIYMVYSSPEFPQPLRASGSGAFNETTDRSRLDLEMSTPYGPLGMIKISAGALEYEGGDLVERELPPGKEWVLTEESEGSGEDETPMNVDDSLELLGASGEIELVGRESINGKMARHYRGEVQLADLVDFLREKGKYREAEAYGRIEGQAPTAIRAEGWVDDQNLLRRLRMVMPVPGERGEPPVTIDMRMDLFDYGAQPDIELPDPDSVVEGPLEDGKGAPAPASVS